MKDINILVVGVGGQGTILSGDILAEVGMLAGMDSKKSDILGLAIRSGSVVSHIRWGEKINAPMSMKGTVDYLLAFEPMEALRMLDYMKKGCSIIVNQYVIPPGAVTTGKATYPSLDEIKKTLGDVSENVTVFNATELAEKTGSTKAVNVLLIGALSALLEIDIKVWEDAVVKFVPPKYKDLNLKAFYEGRNIIKGK